MRFARRRVRGSPEMRCSLLTVVLASAALLSGCSRDSGQTPPTLVATDPATENGIWPLGMTRGTVVIDGDCVALRIPGQPTRVTTLVFPRSYTLQKRWRGWAILTSQGDRWGVVGETRQVGGGALDDGAASRFVGEALLRQCPGPYWLVTPDDPAEMR
jgi:hypothetical protein